MYKKRRLNLKIKYKKNIMVLDMIRKTLNEEEESFFFFFPFQIETMTTTMMMIEQKEKNKREWIKRSTNRNCSV
jgi:hypothetical protein